MTVKDFIEMIRPLTALNPDTDLYVILDDDQVVTFDYLYLKSSGAILKLYGLQCYKHEEDL